MERLKSVFGVIVGLFTLYLILSLGWGVLNMQTCSYNIPKNATCEQIAENNAKNCEYVILKWKKVNYNKELHQCKEWEERQ